jgi:hypothetical protein
MNHSPTHIESKPKTGKANVPFFAPAIQKKMSVGASNDSYEVEADTVADKVMKMQDTEKPNFSHSGSLIQKKCAHCQEEVLRQKPLAEGITPIIQRVASHSGTESVASDRVTSQINSSRGGGSVMDSGTQHFMESRFGTDFSGVRIHTGNQAVQMSRELNAQAFTVGNDVFFNEGKYSPYMNSGKHLLAHELTHTVQQTGGIGRKIQKWDMDNAPIGDPIRDPHVRDGMRTSTVVATVAGTGSFTPTMPDVSQRVIRIVVSCTSMLLRIDTATGSHIYNMDSCSVPEGSYETNVIVNGNVFNLTPQVPDNQPGGFHFRYRIRTGQTNPASLLRNQRTVHVDVIPSLVAPQDTRVLDTPRARRGCLLSLPDQELIPAASASRNLFNPLRFDRNIWSHSVPLGYLGWVSLDANASGQFTGNMNGSYGPGMLRNICLTYEQNRTESSSPIESPLLGSDSHADVTTTVLRGFAEFNMPARAVLRLLASGMLRISGDYLSVISLAAAEGRLTALAEGSLTGSINGRVEITTTATQSRATLTDPLLPLALDLSNTTLTPVDLVAEIGMQGRAGLLFRVDLSAGFEILGHNLWRQSWNLLNFNPSISWAGGIRYRSGSGIEWNLGKTGRDSTLAQPGALSVFNTSESDVDEEDIIDSILNEHQAVVTAPDGLSESTALPFIWYKPIELYPRVLDIPRADNPKEVGRDDGPVSVRYTDRNISVYETIGVADWPAVRRTFEYFPYDSRSEPEKNRFLQLVDDLGYNRSGLDIDHVWDIGLRGLEYDRFDNLWPASNQEQQLAGVRHNIQIRNYRSTLGNINGRWFVIVEFRHPA